MAAFMRSGRPLELPDKPYTARLGAMTSFQRRAGSPSGGAAVAWVFSTPRGGLVSVEFVEEVVEPLLVFDVCGTVGCTGSVSRVDPCEVHACCRSVLRRGSGDGSQHSYWETVLSMSLFVTLPFLSPRKVILAVYTPVALSMSWSSVVSSIVCSGCSAISSDLSSARSNSPFPSLSCSVHQSSSFSCCTFSRLAFFALRPACLALPFSDRLPCCIREAQNASQKIRQAAAKPEKARRVG